MSRTQRKLPYDGGAKALAIADDVREIWRVAEGQGSREQKLFCGSPVLRSIVLALIFGQPRGDGTLEIPDPLTGKRLILPRNR